jgi:histidinol-phosphate aminotransferase
MDANTNLFGTHPAAARVRVELNHYPSAHSDDLRAELARTYGLSPDRIIVGNGSDEILDFLTKAFVRPAATVCVATPSFVMYDFYARVNLAAVRAVPLRPDFQIDPDKILATRAALTFIASPNNPTGNAMDPEAIRTVARRSAGIVVVDEAYAEFCDQNFLPEALGNVVVLRTFSKAFGLAGLRVGWAAASADVIERLHRVKPPFTVGAYAEAVAIAALRDRTFVDAVVREVHAERNRLFRELAAFARPFPSDANFMLVDTGRPAAEVAAAMRARGILVRDMSDFPGLQTCIRFTIGPRAMNDRLLEALRSCCA